MSLLHHYQKPELGVSGGANRGISSIELRGRGYLHLRLDTLFIVLVLRTRVNIRVIHTQSVYMDYKIRHDQSSSDGAAINSQMYP
jgi:hypothetical protein